MHAVKNEKEVKKEMVDASSGVVLMDSRCAAWRTMSSFGLLNDFTSVGSGHRCLSARLQPQPHQKPFWSVQYSIQVHESATTMLEHILYFP